MARPATSVTLRLRGGPYDGQSAVAMNAIVGSLITVNSRAYRVTRVEDVPGRSDKTGIANFERTPEPKKLA